MEKKEWERRKKYLKNIYLIWDFRTASIKNSWHKKEPVKNRTKEFSSCDRRSEGAQARPKFSMGRAGGHEAPPTAEELRVIDSCWGRSVSFL